MNFSVFSVFNCIRLATDCGTELGADNLLDQLRYSWLKPPTTKFKPNSAKLIVITITEVDFLTWKQCRELGRGEGIRIGFHWKKMRFSFIKESVNNVLFYILQKWDHRKYWTQGWGHSGIIINWIHFAVKFYYQEDCE